MSEKRIVAVDSQKLDAIQFCPYNYSLRFGALETTGKEPVETPDYFELGGLLHKMLDIYYNQRIHKSRWALNNKTHADIVASCVEAGRHLGNKTSLDVADIEKVIWTFGLYTSHWENDGWDNILAVENSGSKVLYDSDDLLILYEFKIDLILQMQNVVIPIDHKSMKSHRAPNELSNQFKGYCWALDVNNIIINEIGFQKTVKPVDKFQRHVLSFPQDIIEEWIENSVYWIKYALNCIDNNYFPHNYTSCDKYSGCIYKDVCISERAVRDYKLRSLFKEKTWDVGKDNL